MSQKPAQTAARPTHPDWRRSLLDSFWFRRMESGVTAFVHTHGADRHVGTAGRFAHMSGTIRPTLEAAAGDAVRLAELVDAYEREVGKVSEGERAQDRCKDQLTS